MKVLGMIKAADWSGPVQRACLASAIWWMGRARAEKRGRRLRRTNHRNLPAKQLTTLIRVGRVKSPVDLSDLLRSITVLRTIGARGRTLNGCGPLEPRHESNLARQRGGGRSERPRALKF